MEDIVEDIMGRRGDVVMYETIPDGSRAVPMSAVEEQCSATLAIKKYSLG